MEAVVRIAAVDVTETRAGNRRFAVRTDDDRELATFRPEIGSAAQRLNGQRVRIEFHEEQRGRYHNVYLDRVEPASGEPAGAEPEHDHSSADATAWQTAVEASNWLLGAPEPDEPVDPEQLYEKLRPFKERVARDIRAGEDATEA